MHVTGSSDETGSVRSSRLALSLAAVVARLSRLLKRPISYAAVEVYPGEPARSRRRARRRLAGANVTSPLKEEAAALADSLTPEASALGAVTFYA